ncbi:MAG: hypothetical protein WCG05_04465 [Alphaproteobacteria bacterium]
MKIIVILFIGLLGCVNAWAAAGESEEDAASKAVFFKGIQTAILQLPDQETIRQRVKGAFSASDYFLETSTLLSDLAGQTKNLQEIISAVHGIEPYLLEMAAPVKIDVVNRVILSIIQDYPRRVLQFQTILELERMGALTRAQIIVPNP